MQFFIIVLCGALVGVAEIIPGVSGGTIAVMLNIYDRLIESISHLRRDFKKSIRFLLPLLIGMALAIGAFSFVITYFRTHYRMALNFLFLGLVIGIVPMLLRRATAGRFKVVNLAPFVLLLGLMVLLAFLNSPDKESLPIHSVLTPLLGVQLVVTGFVAAMCMILPGISGSMMMVIFGMYGTVVGSVKGLLVPLLGLVGLSGSADTAEIPWQTCLFILLLAGTGMLLGVIFGAKLVEFTLARFPQATYFGILGLVLGSTIILYREAGLSFATPQGFVAIGMLLVGILLSLFFTSEKNLAATAKRVETEESSASDGSGPAES